MEKLVYLAIFTPENSANSDKFMTFKPLSYSVLRQLRYDNSYMIVIPHKVKHNNSSGVTKLWISRPRNLKNHRNMRNY